MAQTVSTHTSKNARDHPVVDPPTGGSCVLYTYVVEEVTQNWTQLADAWPFLNAPLLSAVHHYITAYSSKQILTDISVISIHSITIMQGRESKSQKTV